MKTLRRPQALEDTRPQLKPIPAWTWTLIAVAALVLTAGVITTWLLIIAGQAAAGTSRTSAQRDAVRTGLAASGGAGAVVGLMLAFRRQSSGKSPPKTPTSTPPNAASPSSTPKPSNNSVTTNAPVRLGGLYALERLAQVTETGWVTGGQHAGTAMQDPRSRSSLCSPQPGSSRSHGHVLGGSRTGAVHLPVTAS